MKCKIIAFLLVLALLAGLPVGAAATGLTAEGQLCSAYWKDDQLYTFIRFQSEAPGNEEVSLFVGNTMRHTSRPQTMAQAGASFHFMLLVDVSPSMEEYRPQILQIARCLMESVEGIRISIAKFNSGFKVVAEDLTEWADVQKAMNSLTYRLEGSDISGSVAAALEHLGERGCEAGEMTNLLVITDGEPWYSINESREQRREAEANQAAVAAMAAYSDVVVHTYSFGEWDEAVYETLSAGSGLHQVDISAQEAGDALVEYAASVYSVTFPLSGYAGQPNIPDKVELWIGRTILSLAAVRNVSVLPDLDMDSDQKPEPTQPTEPAESTEPTQPTTEPTEPTEPTQPTSEPTEPTQPTTETTTPGDDVPSQKNKMGLWWIVAAVGAVILGVIMLVLGKRRPKSAIRMKIEAAPNCNIRFKDCYYLEHELLIGSGRNCDIVIPNIGSGRAAARIFLRDQMVFIENLGSPDGIQLNGVQIFSSNRLRSGDEITIGGVTIRALF